jgi:tyrosinase
MLKSRRAFLTCASAFGLSGAVQGFATALAQSGTVRVREDITVFAKDPNKVAALRAAVGRMKARSAANQDDPLGWYYWSAIHGTDQDVPPALKGIYRQCDHTAFGSFGPPSYVAEHFLTWHRAFLYFFEVTLKLAAKEAKVQTDLELPYWNWYVDSALPAIFIEGDAKTNPLWHKRMNNSINGGALEKAFFAKKVLLPSKPSEFRQTFSVPLEANPHGGIHGAIGGDMGTVPRSARDPIFWLHHANIDRLWAVWVNMGDGRKNPSSDSNWAKQDWKFDAAGTMKLSAGGLTDSEADLKYRYDNIVPIVPPAAPVLTAQAIVVDGAPVQASGGSIKLGTATVSSSTTVSGTGSFALADQSVAVDLRLAPQTQSQFNTLATSAAPPSGGITGAWLVIEDVAVTPQGEQGGFSFNVKATLPDGSGQRSVQLAELNTFNWPAAPSTAGHSHGALAPVTLTIPLTPVLNELNLQKTSDLAKGLRIVFEAVHPQKPGATNVEFVTIGRIQIKTSNAPIQ